MWSLFNVSTFISALLPAIRIVMNSHCCALGVFYFRFVFQCRFCLALALEALLKALIERWLVRLLNVCLQIARALHFTYQFLCFVQRVCSFNFFLVKYHKICKVLSCLSFPFISKSAFCFAV